MQFLRWYAFKLFESQSETEWPLWPDSTVYWYIVPPGKHYRTDTYHGEWSFMELLVATMVSFWLKVAVTHYTYW